MDFKGSVFVVTGGSSGLGAATARMIVKCGGKVVLADINPKTGEELATNIGAGTLFVKTDVVSEQSAQEVFAKACELGVLRGLVNCAGVAPAERVVGREGVHKLENFTQVININLIGTFNMVRLAAEIMGNNAPNHEGERGVIINTASVAAFEGQLGQAAYAASKGGVVAMGLPIARELARSGIRVMTIAPGIMETPMMQGMPKKVQDALNESIPFPSRMGKADEYAALVNHIFTNAYLNGTVIRLDGAIRMNTK